MGSCLKFKFTLILLVVFNITFCNNGFGQQINLKKIQYLSKQFDFNYALESIDSNLLVVEDSLLYFELLYEKAVIYENFEEPKEALFILNELDSLIGDSNIDLEIRILIERSLIFEKLNFQEKCFTELEKARKLIESHDKDVLKCFYHLRKASSLRVTNNYEPAILEIDSSIYYGEIHKDTINLCHSFLVKSFLSEDIRNKQVNIKKSMEYSILAKDRKIYTAAIFLLMQWEMEYGEIEIALNYSRKIIDEISLSNSSTEHSYVFFFIADIYESAGKLDSALYFQRIGIETNSEYEFLKSKVQVSEIIEKYENEKHIAEIEKQNQELEYNGKLINIGLTITIILIVLCLVILKLYFNGKRFLNQTIKQQNEIKSVNEQLSRSLKQENILKQELHHRVKNNLQTIISLLDLRENQSEEIKSISQQIFSISAGHELLYLDQINDEITLDLYLKKLTSHLLDGYSFSYETKLNLSIDSIQLDLDIVIPLGLIINELMANSFKYAKRKNEILKIEIKIIEHSNQLMITYSDNGPGFKDCVGNFGTFVIDTMISQLEGNLKKNTINGVFYEIVLNT